ncbi:MAG: LPS export ABC transporter periplasmic protein LptC [Xenococcaceae cyanobacterium]
MKFNRAGFEQVVVRVTRYLTIVLLLNLYGCGQPNPVPQKTQDDSAQASPAKTRLVLNNATLEEADDRGQTLWKIKAQKSTYSEDNKKAYLENLAGNLFQDGKLVLQISAKQGEVNKDGEVIFLRDNIIARDPRNNAVVEGDEVEWHPKNNVLVIRKNLTGNHPQLEVTATEGQYNTRSERLELTGNVIATALQEKLQLKTQQLIWFVSQQKIRGDRPLEITRYRDRIVSDRVIADRGYVTLNNHLAFLEKNVELQSLKPLTQIATNSAIWNYNTRVVTSDRPIRMVNAQEQITVTGNRGQIDLEREIAKLQGGVSGISSKNQAKLFSKALTWKITTQIVEATGNVIYKQNDPQLNLTGDKAVGTLQNNNVVVTSNNKERVVTNITP